jgi:hypothetical protein
MKVVALTLAIIASSAAARWIDFGMDVTAATVEVVESTPTGMVLELTLPGVEILDRLENGVAYSVVNVPGTTPRAIDAGYPVLPTVSFLAAIPAGGVEFTVLENETVDLGYHTVSPMQPILPENTYDAPPFTVEPAAYGSGTYPDSQTGCIVDGTLRGVTLGRMTITPFYWNAQTGLLTASRRMRVRVDFQGAVSLDPRLNSRFWHPVWDQVLINPDVIPEPVMTLSHEGCEPVKAVTRRQIDDLDAADLLIIAGDDFVDTVMDDFLDVKMEQGYLTAIVAAGSWGTDSIKSFIQEAYDTWTIPPSFILFVGDSPQLPPYYANGTYSDNRYVCMDGSSDYQADIFHGRFVTPTDFYGVVEGKCLKWEFDPLMDPDFWNTALCAGMIQTYGTTTAARWFLFTCETVRDTYMNIYGKTVEREYVKDTSQPEPYYYNPGLPSAGQQVPIDIDWTGSAAGISGAINDGVFLVQHRDHGAVSGWSDPAYTTTNVLALTNGEKTPLVFSINCLTGQFTGNCFAENFVTMQGNSGGAAAVVAATEVSYSYFNDYFCYGMYFSFNDEYTSPPFSYTNPSMGYLGSQAIMNGKLEMEAAAPYNPYGPWQAYVEDEWDLFHFFGDPTMDLRTELPYDQTVLAPPPQPRGAPPGQFIVSDPTDGPVELALVCLRKPDEGIWISGLTNSSGVVTLSFPAIATATAMPWMVTAHNAYPEWGAINGVGIDETVTAGITTVGRPYPNPSGSEVYFPVSLEAAGNVTLTVYDLSGRTVSVVHDGELAAGSHQLVWNGRSGEDAAPMGIYVARLVSPDGGISVSKIVLSR